MLWSEGKPADTVTKDQWLQSNTLYCINKNTWKANFIYVDKQSLWFKPLQWLGLKTTFNQLFNLRTVSMHPDSSDNQVCYQLCILHIHMCLELRKNVYFYIHMHGKLVSLKVCRLCVLFDCLWKLVFKGRSCTDCCSVSLALFP